MFPIDRKQERAKLTGMSKRALIVLAAICLFCIGYAHDPLPGDWRRIGYETPGPGDQRNIVSVVGDSGVVIHIEYDSTTGTYIGIVKVVSDSMTALGWSAGDAKWWGMEYTAQNNPWACIWPKSGTPLNTVYTGYATTRFRERRQTTPDNASNVIATQDYPAWLVVLIDETADRWPRCITGADTNMESRCDAGDAVWVKTK